MLPPSLAAVKLCFPEQVLLPVGPIHPTQQHPRACPRFPAWPTRRTRTTMTATTHPNDDERRTYLIVKPLHRRTAGIHRLIVKRSKGEERASESLGIVSSCRRRSKSTRSLLPLERRRHSHETTLSCRSGGLTAQRERRGASELALCE
jgi:hypothetical protein